MATETDETHAKQSTKNEKQPEQHTRLETRKNKKKKEAVKKLNRRGVARCRQNIVKSNAEFKP